MNRNLKLLTGAASCLAMALPVTLADVALSQTQTETPSTRQIVVESQKEEKPAAKAAEPAKTEVKTDAGKADAGKTEKAAAPEKAETGVIKTIPAAGTPAKSDGAKTEEVKPKEEPAAKTVAAPEAKDAAQEKPAEKVNIALTLQTELKRVGCYRGSLDGLWGPRSAAALDAFAHHGKVDHADLKPSEIWIKHVKAKTKTVCSGYYGYARPGPGYRPGYRQGPRYYDRRPGYGRPPPGGYRRGGYRY